MLADGVAAEFPIGGTVTTLGGVRCETGEVVRLEATSVDGETYVTTATQLAFDGTALTTSGTDSATITADDPTLADSGSFNCDGLSG